jgi:2,4-dienoyl-CoA reductase-like NADH-dependent reductase (Old Yellow Enzyme family)
MSILFDSFELNGLKLANRFIRSATFDACADKEGYVTDRQIELLKELAEGEVAFIISAASNVHPGGQVRSYQINITNNCFIPGLKKLTDAIHRHGVKIALQLMHAGRFSAQYLKTKGLQAVAPFYLVNDPYFDFSYRTMSEEEIWEVVDSFGNAALRAREANFDAVQIHGCHGSLFSQFLSPFINQREDQWGGDLNGRLRIHREVYYDICRKVGDDFPVFIKFGVQDGFPEGLKFTEGKQAAIKLANTGFNALEISAGMRGTGYVHSEMKTNIDAIEKEAYYRNWCREIKKVTDVPVIIVGGLRTFDLMEEIVKNAEADLVALCRPFIREPDLVKKWEADRHYQPTCISCNKCNQGVAAGKRLRCFQPDNI